MARIRTIKPEFPQSETIGKLSRDARLLFIQLWTLADDEGRSRAASRMLASLLFPYDDDAPSLIDGWLDELEAEGCIRRYEVDGTKYLDIPNWSKHQKVDHKSASRLPAFSGELASPREPSRALAPDLGPSTMDLGPRTDAGASAPDAPAPKMIGNWPEADVVRSRQDLVSAYGGGLDAPPDVVGTFNTWVAAYGWEPAVIVAAVTGRISDPEKRKKPLRYWENAVREVFAKRAAEPPPAEPSAPAPPRRANFEKMAFSTWLGLVDIWRINKKWSEFYGPAPDEPGCHVPPEVLERFDLKPVVAVLQ